MIQSLIPEKNTGLGYFELPTMTFLSHQMIGHGIIQIFLMLHKL